MKYTKYKMEKQKPEMSPVTIVTDTRGGLLLPGHGVHRGHKPHVDGAVSLQSVGRLVSLQVAAAIAAIHVF